MNNDSNRLGNRYLHAIHKSKNTGILSPLGEALGRGEAGHNIIPGGVPTNDIYPVIIVHAIRTKTLIANKRHRSAEFCLKSLIKQLKGRANNGNETSSIKIILDEVNPEIFSRLLEVAQLSVELNAALQIDLVLTEDAEPLRLENPYLNQVGRLRRGFIYINKNTGGKNNEP